jgi:enoyl-CoA hydratase
VTIEDSETTSSSRSTPRWNPLSTAELVRELASPYSIERYSTLTGEPILIADLRGCEAGCNAESLNAARRALLELPCPSVAICEPQPSAVVRSLESAFDLVLPDDRDLPAIVSTVQTNPIASLSLVQLLRHSADLSTHEGLIAESIVYSMLQTGPEFAAWLAERPTPKTLPGNDEPALLLLRDGAKLHMTFNRADRRNAFSAEMRDALTEALQVVIADPSIEEAILRGAGPAFCSGGDLDEFGTLPDPATAHVIRSTRNPARLLSHCASRVRSEVQGACVGAGMELPAFTRHVRAREDAWFWLPEVAMGLVPGAGGTVSVPRRIGRQRSNWMALTHRRIDAETALAWGLIDEIV